MKMQENIKRRDLKFVWQNDGHTSASGYGVFTRDLLTRLFKDGWNFAEIAFYTLHGQPINQDGWKVYPTMGHPFGSDALTTHSADFGANAVFTMQDIWPFDPNDLAKIKYFCPYTPIDKDPVPPAVLDKLRFAYKIITFSKFGQKALQDAGYTSTLIVEGTDTEIFKPADKMQMRKELGISEDVFIFGSIAANKENPPRKGFQQMLEAFKLFSPKHPEARLFFHTQQTAPGNFPIMEYANYLGFADKVMMMNPYIASYKSDSNQIAKELNAFDVCLHPSQTEGFGLVIVESQSCGIPVIVNRVHSMTELVKEGVTGEICEPDKPLWTSVNSYIYPANVDSLHDKMEIIYKKLHEKNTIAKDCRDWVVENYNINTLVKDKWIPFLNSLQEEILPIVDNKEEKVDNKLP